MINIPQEFTQQYVAGRNEWHGVPARYLQPDRTSFAPGQSVVQSIGDIETMKTQPFVVTPKDYNPALNVLGVRITVLAPNTATHGYEITLQEGDEGAGPPPHSHAWDESFYVLKGNVEIICEDKTVMCVPGTLVHVPAGTVHGYRFGEGGGEMFEVSGHGGFATQMFTNVSKAIPPGPPDIAKLLGLLKENGVTVAA